MITILDFKSLDWFSDDYLREKLNFICLNKAGEIVGGWFGSIYLTKEYFEPLLLGLESTQEIVQEIPRPAESVEYYTAAINEARAAGLGELVLRLVDDFNIWQEYDQRRLEREQRREQKLTTLSKFVK